MIPTRARVGFALALLAAFLVPQVSAGTSDVTRVSLTPRSDGLGYVMRIHTSEQVNAFTDVRKVGQFSYELTLFGSSIANSYQPPTLPSPIMNIHLVPREGNVVLRFGLSGSFEVSAYRDRGTTDILIGLEHVEALPSAEPVALLPRGPTDTARRRWLLDTIVIDAGHGGKDPGTSAYGLREKDITLAIAKKLGGYLRDELGVRVVYTRSDDRFVDLEDRGKMANESGGKLFVSIHVNASARSRSAAGTETYFLGMHKTSTAREVMERENAVINLEANPDRYKGYTQDELIRLALAQSAFMHQSELLASRIEGQFVDRVGRESRGVKQAGFIVLWAASMPAVLVETGFITNRAEANYLTSETGQTYIASAIYRAIRDFKVAYETELRLAGPVAR
jgi:N-acetylmuramoyl-L-alanine amidase